MRRQVAEGETKITKKIVDFIRVGPESTNIDDLSRFTIPDLLFLTCFFEIHTRDEWQKHKNKSDLPPNFVCFDF